MVYRGTRRGIFCSRPNRFVAEVELDGEIVICHVKNTGRCRELLEPGVIVILAPGDNPQRKTRWDLIAVYKNGMLINMDSQAPNQVFGEWVRIGGFLSGITGIRPECFYGDSRLDFYLESAEQRIFAEVKGVTLEEDGVVLFPDAPTERGIKHIRELIRAVQEGYGAYLVFVIQMEACRYFTPNRRTQPAFAEVLKEAEQAGVKLLAVNCRVGEDFLEIDHPVPIVL